LCKVPDEAAEIRRRLELLWGVARPTRPGPRPGLRVEQIVRAAIAYADRHGLDGLTMRRLATELDIGPASLYTYVPGRNTLLSLMLDAIAGYSVLPHTLPGGWRERLEGWAREDWALFHQHPWVLELVTREHLPGPNLMAWYDSVLRTFAGTGLADHDKIAAIEAIDGYVRGAAWASAGARAGGTASATEAIQTSAVSTAMAELFDPARFPELARVIAGGASPFDLDTFEHGLAYVLDGIELRITRTAGEPPRP
jgi:AcrR family transcriptional regulator